MRSTERDVTWDFRKKPRPHPSIEEHALTTAGNGPDQGQRLDQIRARVVEARRELDALIGDAYLRPRASIVPVHFLDLASAVEKLRWAEKEWRELEKENEAQRAEDPRVEAHDLVEASN